MNELESPGLWGAIFAILIMFDPFGACSRPQRAACPTMNEYVEGVRRDGSTWCARSPSLRELDCAPRAICKGREPEYTVPLKITCTSATRL